MSSSDDKPFDLDNMSDSEFEAYAPTKVFPIDDIKQPKQTAKSKATPTAAPKNKNSASKVTAQAAPKPKATKKKPLIDQDEDAEDVADDEDDDAPTKAAATGAAGPAKKKPATEKVRAHD